MLYAIRVSANFIRLNISSSIARALEIVVLLTRAVMVDVTFRCVDKLCDAIVSAG
jgi:hypothetical protein